MCSVSMVVLYIISVEYDTSNDIVIISCLPYEKN